LNLQNEEFRLAETLTNTQQRSNRRDNPLYRAAENEFNNIRRTFRANDFERFIQSRVAELETKNIKPPTADQLLFIERNAQAALQMNYKNIGHEHIDASNSFVELR
jgi:hypothetical protein